MLTIGTIVEGSHDYKHVTDGLADALIVCADGEPELVAQANAAKESAAALSDNPDEFETDSAIDVICDLMSALEEFCPPYTYIGQNCNPDTVADYGVWPSNDAIIDTLADGDILAVSDLSDVPEGKATDVIITNDHGNKSCGHVDEAGNFTLYWDCV